MLQYMITWYLSSLHSCYFFFINSIKSVDIEPEQIIITVPLPNYGFNKLSTVKIFVYPLIYPIFVQSQSISFLLFYWLMFASNHSIELFMKIILRSSFTCSSWKIWNFGPGCLELPVFPIFLIYHVVVYHKSVAAA